MENKKEFYNDLYNELYSLIGDERNAVAILANTSALLNYHMKNINWVGFYLVNDNELILGPFQGNPACMHIPFTKGVCGACYRNDETIIVDNVHNFSGHIACDSNSNSEIVIPIHKNNEIVGLLDIDSPIYSRFDNEDKLGLESIVAMLEMVI